MAREIIDREELGQHLTTFERVEMIDEIIILGREGGIRRIMFKSSVEEGCTN